MEKIKPPLRTKSVIQRSKPTNVKALSTPNGHVMSTSPSNATLTVKMGMQPILAVTVTVKKIKGTARQCYFATLGVNRPLHVTFVGADPELVPGGGANP